MDCAIARGIMVATSCSWVRGRSSRWYLFLRRECRLSDSGLAVGLGLPVCAGSAWVG